MPKGKVGIYVFTDMIKRRTTKKREMYFDGLNYLGLRYIVDEINQDKWEIKHVSKDTINTVDFVLVSLQSYYDIINLINELHGKKKSCQIIVGGPGCNNVRLLRDIADIAVVGRGEGLVNDLLEGKPVDGVWYRETNYEFGDSIKILPLKRFLDIEDKYLGNYKEHSIGCQKKCFFCEYSWKHKYTTNKDEHYTSGIMNRETRLDELDWGVYTNKDLVTAIDGATEQTRKIINKPITNNEIRDKLLEVENHERDYYSLKLYCLLGYPFEDKFEPEEMIENIAYVNERVNKRLNVLMVSPHFIPMPFTPMECEAVNFTNFRELLKGYNFGDYRGGKVNLYWSWTLASGPISAAEATVLNRCEDAGLIKKVMCSSKYKSLKGDQKKLVLQKYFGDLLGKVDSVVPYVERSNKTDSAKTAYRKKVCNNMATTV